MIVRFQLKDGTIVEKDIPGIPGKSAYQYAVEAGYTGTPEEFAAKLAADSPRAFYITVSGDAENGYTVDKTAAEIMAAYNNGCTLFAAYPDEDNILLTLMNSDAGDGWLLFGVTVFPITYVITLSIADDEVFVDQADTWEINADLVGALPVDSVMASGAFGDGVTDDTAAFQSALAANRCVYVPGGTYVLSDTIVIGENCCLELSQDTVLQFTNPSGNCIEMRGSAVLRGNHAVISVPYEFTSNVISLDTALDGNNHASIPPYTKADPMWKRQRFVYDVNIIKPNAAGFNRSVDGVCNGTAIHMSAYNNPDSTTDIPWMWAITMSGVRIAGGFSYGIRAVNYDDPNGYTGNAWNHDMRIEAVIEGCEIGVALENCNGAHLKVTVQPNVATGNNAAYAKHGVYLNDSRFVDMIGSRIWDWNAKSSLWTEGGEYQHLALIGNCRGLLLDDFLVYETSEDIRSLIYTDTANNFDTMTILQEPSNKWFKSVDNKPYFNDGTTNREIQLKSEKITAEQANFIKSADGYYVNTPNFTNLVSNYQDGYYEDGGSLVALAGYTTTDFIPIDGGDTHVYRIGGEGISWSDDYYYCRIAWYDSSKALKGSVMSWEKIGSSIYYPTRVEDENAAFAFATNANVAPPNGAAYFRITAKGSGTNLIVTIDEKQDYSTDWVGQPKRLDESIYAMNAALTSPSGKNFRLVVSDDGTLSTEEISE